MDLLSQIRFNKVTEVVQTLLDTLFEALIALFLPPRLPRLPRPLARPHEIDRDGGAPCGGFCSG